MVLSKIVSVLFFLSLVTFLGAQAQPEMTKNAHKEIRKHWEVKDNYLLSVKKDKHLEVFSVQSGDKKLGWAVLAEVKGRHDYFDVLLIYSGQGILEHTKVLVYRSSYGTEVTNPRWLRQFYGSSADRELRYKKDIDGLSGATFSAESLVKMVNKGNARIVNLIE